MGLFKFDVNTTNNKVIVVLVTKISNNINKHNNKN